MSDKLIIKIPLFKVIKLKIIFFIYKIYNSIKDHFKLIEGRDYSFQGDRLNQEQIDKYNNFGETNIPKYITSQPKEEIKVSSEYFLYKKILEKDKKQDLRICNVGAFYCISEDYFLKKRPKSIIHGLDFAPFIKFNKEFEQPNLILHPGYPLDTIEKFARESNGYMFDYVIFIRTATLINKNEIVAIWRLFRK